MLEYIITLRKERKPEKDDVEITPEQITNIIEKLKENLKSEKVEIVKEKKKEQSVYIQGYEVDEENILSVETMEALYNIENQDMESFINAYGTIKNFCKSKRITGFDKFYKMYKESKREVFISTGTTLMFPDLTDKAFKTNRYEISEEGYIYEIIPNV